MGSEMCIRDSSWVDQKFTVERPALSFITQDEIDAVLRRGGITAGGRNRIYEYFMEHHDMKDAAKFLKNEYGTGGAAPGIPGAYESDASHDAKGLKLAKGKIGSPDVEVLLKWNKVAERVRQLIRTDDFLSPEVRKYLAERADLLGAIRLPNTAFKANAGTEVSADILFFQKRDSMTKEMPEWVNL